MTKLVNQVLSALQFQAVAEAMALAGGRADTCILLGFGARMARRDYSPTGQFDSTLKDLDGVQALARATNSPLPPTAIVAEIHRVLVGTGFGGSDYAEFMRQFDGPRDILLGS